MATDFITIDDIRKLFRKHFGISITRAAIYNYQKSKNFPPHIGLGRPRLWRKDLVVAWLNHQTKQ